MKNKYGFTRACDEATKTCVKNIDSGIAVDVSLIKDLIETLLKTLSL